MTNILNAIAVELKFINIKTVPKIFNFILQKPLKKIKKEKIYILILKKNKLLTTIENIKALVWAYVQI